MLQFSLVELLIVMAVFALLISILQPSLNKLVESSHRVECGTHLRQIALGATTYANDFDGFVPRCRKGLVQIAFDTALFDMIIASGWSEDKEKMVQTWNCPSRDFETNELDLYGQWIIGYQYFGGISRWRNPMGWFTSKSPVNLNTAQPDWALAADTTSKIDGEWGGGRATAYKDMPSHKVGGSNYPEGGNQVYMDGSVAWASFYDMLFLHSWGGQNRIFYFYQKDIGGIVPQESIKAKY